jgi:short subunit dehydrogenase-like uncharacterized protein
LYGAGGYTGRLIAKRLHDAGVDLVVAGRPSSRVVDLARALRCEWRTARIEDKHAIAAMLKGIGIVVNAAGPFAATASLLTSACIDAGCHYLDVGGEAEPYGFVRGYGGQAASKGVVLLPGVGFCVVASNFLLRELLAEVSNPVAVRIAFEGGPASSVGSMKSLYASLLTGVLIVRDGRVKSVPIGSIRHAFQFTPQRERVIGTVISVADTFAARQDAPASVKRIESYVEGSEFVRGFYEASGRATSMTKVQPWQDLIDRAMVRWPATPGSGIDTRASVLVEVDDPWRVSKKRHLDTPSSYDFTARVTAEAVVLLLSGMAARPGFHTPASLFFGNPVFTRSMRAEPAVDAAPAA